MMKDLPACRECKRTHTSVGNLISLKATGEHEGICKACRKRLGLVKPTPAQIRALERDTRALEYWLNTVYRPSRRVNRTLTT